VRQSSTISVARAIPAARRPPPQLALDQPASVQSLILLELSLRSVPSGEAFLEQVEPVFEAYGSGDHSGAMAMFMTAMSGLDWTTCRALLEQRVPGAVEQAIRDADTFFRIELPALTKWAFGRQQQPASTSPSCPCWAPRSPQRMKRHCRERVSADR
jgi:hypothetical protein